MFEDVVFWFFSPGMLLGFAKFLGILPPCVLSGVAHHVCGMIQLVDPKHAQVVVGNASLSGLPDFWSVLLVRSEAVVISPLWPHCVGRLRLFTRFLETIV